MTARLSALVAGLVLFSIVHSALAAGSVREWVARRFVGTAQHYRLAYNAVALVLLAAIMILTRGDYPTLWRASGLARAALVGVQALAVAGFALTVSRFEMGEFLGVRPASARGRGGSLDTGGVYGLCRHPLYFFVGLFFSAWPTMDLRWLVIALWLWTYSYLGSILEERKLVRDFGAAYRSYQETHHRLLPLGRRGGGPRAGAHHA